MPEMSLVHVPSLMALPFVRRFERRLGVTISHEDAYSKVTWCGVTVRGQLRAVLGLQPTSEEDGCVFVWGLFGDCSGSPDEMRAGIYLLRILDKMPFRLQGCQHVSNLAAHKHASKIGWKYLSTKDEMELWERPALGAAQ